MRRLNGYLLLAGLLTLSVRVSSAQTVHFVDESAVGAQDGTSWQDAYVSLQEALAVASSGDQIWIAEGTYTPHSEDRTMSFKLVDGVRLHGGFAGDETSLIEREPASHPTVLSGDLADDDAGFSMRDENAYHVVRAENLGDNTLLEGIVIRAGHANGVDADSLGGGILVDGGSPSMINVEFIGNYGRCGGGIAVTNSASPELVNVVINGNRALGGGGICSVDASASIQNATITANTADAGAGLYNRNASPNVSNSIVSGNVRPGDIPDCMLLQYPCKLADTSADVRARTFSLLDELGSIRSSGTIDDVREHLQAQSDVVELISDSRALRFRVANGAPAWFIETEPVPPASPDLTSAIEERHSLPVRASLDTIGEDQDGDGDVDNRDGKRALLLSPLAWLYGANDPVPDVSMTVGALVDYANDTTVKMNQNSNAGSVGVADFGTWKNFDLIFVSTVGSALCYEESTIYEPDPCIFVIMTGEPATADDISAAAGVEVVELFDSPTEQVVGYFKGVTPQYFRDAYDGSLQNAMVFLSGGESIPETSSELVLSLGKEPFNLLGWTRRVYRFDAFLVAVNLFDYLAEGLHLRDAFAELREEGFTSFINSDGESTALIAEVRGGQPLRIREVITIRDESGPLAPGSSVEITRENGTDRLTFFVQVDGVLPSDKNDYSITIELDGTGIGGTYDLSNASQVGAYSYLTELSDVDTGTQLGGEDLVELAAIVDLPEGGESKYSVLVQTAPCHFDVNILGDFTATFDGPAKLRYVDESTVAIEFESRGFVNGDTGTSVFTGSIGAGPGVTVPDSYEITGASANQGSLIGGYVFRSSFLMGSSLDCEGCGGTLNLSSMSDESLSGSFSVTLPVQDPEPPEGQEPFEITMDGTFSAVVGPSSDPDSPFTQCRITYADD